MNDTLANKKDAVYKVAMAAAVGVPLFLRNVKREQRSTPDVPTRVKSYIFSDIWFVNRNSYGYAIGLEVFRDDEQARLLLIQGIERKFIYSDKPHMFRGINRDSFAELFMLLSDGLYDLPSRFGKVPSLTGFSKLTTIENSSNYEGV